MNKQLRNIGFVLLGLIGLWAFHRIEKNQSILMHNIRILESRISNQQQGVEAEKIKQQNVNIHTLDLFRYLLQNKQPAREPASTIINLEEERS